MKPKEVLDNFKEPDPMVEVLKETITAREKEIRRAYKQCESLYDVIREALKEATTGEHVDRAIRAAHVLESGLKEHGWPEGEE